MSSGADSAFSKPVVQYIFCRRDLQNGHGEPWPTGAVAAQVSHASVAAIVEGIGAEDKATIHYTSSDNLANMTKYVFAVDSADELETIRQSWDDKFGTTYYCWIEQPENIPTAMASWPIERTNRLSKFVQKLKLSFL